MENEINTDFKFQVGQRVSYYSNEDSGSSVDDKYIGEITYKFKGHPIAIERNKYIVQILKINGKNVNEPYEVVCNEKYLSLYHEQLLYLTINKNNGEIMRASIHKIEDLQENEMLQIINIDTGDLK